MAEPDDLGAAVVYLISAASSWVTGAMQTVDGGFPAWYKGCYSKVFCLGTDFKINQIFY